MDPSTPKQYLHGIVDMGSNGIRFSISDLQPSTTRLMPTFFQRRAAISLYDVQYSSGTKAPIPRETINEIVQEFRHFATVCADFEVPKSNVRLLATEATRGAINSQELRDEIKEATGWEVELLDKEDEGLVGAAGIASSFREVNGIVMDLGGGSTQLTLVRTINGEVDTGKGSVSLPFGAAALLRRLQEADRDGKQGRGKLKEEIQEGLRHACKTIGVMSAQEQVKSQSSTTFNLYTSGGGFRGWGTVLMDTHRVSPYPIPIINGFAISPDEFGDAVSVTQRVANEQPANISDRRASQVPAVAFLVTALLETLPKITRVFFCQGGVREGALFLSLDQHIRAQPPLEVATQPYAPETASRDKLAEQLANALPEHSTPHSDSRDGIDCVLKPFVNMLYAHTPCAKDARPAIALRTTTSGLLAGTHGVSHDERVMLALLLCERWGGAGDLSASDEPFFAQLRVLAGPQRAWWAMYLGRVAALLCAVYPAGKVGTEKVSVRCEYTRDSPKEKVCLKIKLAASLKQEWFAGELGRIEKAGKKKNWIGGKEGWGIGVEVVVE